jgi:hypothetical protein
VRGAIENGGESDSQKLTSILGKMQSFSTTSRDKLSSKNLNSVRNSDKLKNTATPSSGEFFSPSTGKIKIFIFLVLRVLLPFLISRDVMMVCIYGYHIYKIRNQVVESGCFPEVWSVLGWATPVPSTKNAMPP